MVVEFMLKGSKIKTDTDTIISMLEAGDDIGNEYIIGVIQELVAKCEELEPLNYNMPYTPKIVNKQKKEIERLEAELKQLKEENEKAKLNTHNIDWERFKTGNIAVHCKTRKEAEDFIGKSIKHIKIWCDKDKIDVEHTHWRTNENETCYVCNNIGLIISSRETSHQCGREILEWSDYMVGCNE